MTQKLKPMTAAEFLAQRESDPEWVAARAKREEEHRKRTDQLRQAEVPLIEELHAAGVDVKTTWDLLSFKGSYSHALPTLFEHLSRPYPSVTREGIARAFGVRELKPLVWDRVIRLYREERDKRVKDGLAGAISDLAERADLDEVYELLQDRSCGSSRLLLLSALTRTRDPRSIGIIEGLADDPDLYKEIAVILRRRELRRAKKRQR